MKQPSFFDVFAGIVDRSGLNQMQIANKTNEGAKGTVLELCPPVHQSTISRMYRRIDCPRDKLLLLRIAKFGLDQSDQQCEALERLRKEEAVTHTTSHHSAVKAPSTDELAPLPAKGRERY